MRFGIRLGCLLSLTIASCTQRKPTSYSGFVDAPVAAVAAQVAGQVATIDVQEGDRVRPGQLLAQLDARERIALVAESEANLDHAREAVHEAERNAQAISPTVRAAEADVARQQAELDNAAAEFERSQQLARQQVATPSQLDAARARLEQARAAVASTGATHQASRGRAIAALAAVRTAHAALWLSMASIWTSPRASCSAFSA